MGKALVNWAKLKEEYIACKLLDPTYTIKQISDKHGVGYQVVAGRSTMEGWNKEYKARQAKENQRIIQGINHALQAGIDRLEDNFITKELEIRKRHTFYARTLQHISMAKLSQVNIDELCVKDALRMYELGITHERMAMGFQDTMNLQLIAPGTKSGETPEDHIREYKRLQGLKHLFLNSIEGEYSHVPPG